MPVQDKIITDISLVGCWDPRSESDAADVMIYAKVSPPRRLVRVQWLTIVRSNHNPRPECRCSIWNRWCFGPRLLGLFRCCLYAALPLLAVFGCNKSVRASARVLIVGLEKKNWMHACFILFLFFFLSFSFRFFRMEQVLGNPLVSRL